MAPLDEELRIASLLAREAGALLLQVYATDFAVEDKAGDQGPVTEADRLANALLLEQLRRHFPGDGVVAEETKDTSDARRFARCWYVDPMDGTREFVRRNGEFAVHIGLAVEGDARLGVVYRPVGDRLYAGVTGEGCWLEAEGSRRTLRVEDVGAGELPRLVVSRSHRTVSSPVLREKLGVGAVRECGSVGLKCGLIAEGEADIYVHTSPKSYRWDACAPEALLRAAGGVFTDLAGAPYRYDGSELQNLRGLLAGTPWAHAQVLPRVSAFRVA
jgi:3'(2'), 5'-bisphosphate nucleotidase